MGDQSRALTPRDLPPGHGDRYGRLREYLEKSALNRLTLSFSEIETILGRALPASARNHQAWWSNSRGTHTQSGAWLDIGWRTQDVRLDSARVTFVRVVTRATMAAPSAGETHDVESRGGGRQDDRALGTEPSASAQSAPAKTAGDRPASDEGSEEAMRIGLVGCVKTKLDRPAAAKDLYGSPLFRGRRTYVEQSCDRWFILSAKLGVVDPDDVIEPYEQTLKTASEGERRRWSQMVLTSLDVLLGDCTAVVFEMHAGADYVDHGLAAGLLERGAELEYPVKGLRMGEQLAWYASHDAASSRSGDTPQTADGLGAAAASPKDAPPMALAAEDRMIIEGGTAGGERKAQDDGELRVALDALAFAPHLVRAREWPDGFAGLPGLNHPGLYVWHVDAIGAEQLSAGLGHAVMPGRIYVGQAGARSSGGSSSSATLKSRIGGNHLNGNIGGSTFRLSLAAILADELGLEKTAAGKLGQASEAELSQWMRAHLAAAIFAIPDRSLIGSIEEAVVRRLDPPLNLRHCDPSPVRDRLTQLRTMLAAPLPASPESPAERLAGFIRSLDGFAIPDVRDVPYGHMGATITDAILQAGLNYEHVVWPRVERVRHTVPATTTSGFIEACEQRGAGEVIGWSHETKLTRIAALAGFLAGQGIETEVDLRRWLCDADAQTSGERRARLLALPGIGPKTVDYLAILSGDTSAVAPDVHQLRFLRLAGIEIGGSAAAGSQATGSAVGDSEITGSTAANHERTDYERARDIVIRAANILGVAPSALDHAIWAYMSGSNAMW